MSASPHFGDRIRVVTIDGHTIVRDGIRDAIGSALEMSVVGEAGTVEQGFEAIRAREPDVAIVDVTLPDGHGFDLMRNLRAQRPGVQTLMFSICDEKIYAERALQAGASGYVMKASSSEILLEAVREVAEGKVYLSEEMSRTVVNGLSGGRKGGTRFPIDDLTERELQVFQMLGRGLAVDAIAERLNRARKTVEAHRRRDVTFIVDANTPGEDDPGDRLSIAAMYTQSNDAFYAFAPRGIPLFDDNEEPISGDVTEAVRLYDAQTEQDEEPGIGINQALRQSAAGSGPTEAGTVVRVEDTDGDPFLDRDGFNYRPPSDVLRITITPMSQ